MSAWSRPRLSDPPRPLKLFLVELALGWAGSKSGRVLDRRYRLPRMRYKGDAPQPQAVRLDARPLVTELAEAPRAAPAFPLLVRRPASAAAARAGPGPAGPGSAPPDAAGGPGAGAAKAPAAVTPGTAAARGGGGARADERPPPAQAAESPEASMPSHTPATAWLPLYTPFYV